MSSASDPNVSPLLAWLDGAGADVAPELDRLIDQTARRLKLLQALRRSIGTAASTSAGSSKKKAGSSKPVASRHDQADASNGNDISATTEKLPVAVETLELLASILHDQGELSVARLAELAGVSDWTVRQALKHDWFERDAEHKGGKVRLTEACELWPSSSAASTSSGHTRR